MANTYFHFKQFTVNQEYCGMKVTTDACLFGAWVAKYFSENKILKESPFNVLDIGTGTGLLALMIAQISSNINVDGVEIEGLAAQQATENFQASNFINQLKAIHKDIKNFNAPITNGYDFIITNPPFFDDDLKSSSHNRNLAMHSLDLSLQDLVSEIKRLLKNEGTFAILLPYHRTDFFIELASNNSFKLLDALFVKQTTKHPYFRGMLLFIKEDSSVYNDNKSYLLTKNELVIKEGIDYSIPFKELLQPYYLKL